METNGNELLELKPAQLKALAAVKSMQMSGIALDGHLKMLTAYIAALETKLLEFAQKLDEKGV